MKLLYNPEFIGEKLFPFSYWHTINSKILLTFDDGPSAETTEIILEKISRLKIKTIFFCVGNNVTKYPQLVRAIKEEGHEIGNHTFQHSTLLYKPKNFIKQTIIQTNKAIKKAANTQPKFFRPPKGRFFFSLKSILSDLQMQNVMWNLLTFDYKNDLNIVKFALTNFLKANSIVVMHDNKKNKSILADEIELIFDVAKEKNLEFGAPLECLK